MRYKYPAGEKYYREVVNLHPVGGINIPEAETETKK